MTANKPLVLLRPAAIAALLLAALLSVTTAFAQDDDSYTVESGDTLFSIAREFGVSVSDLAFANGITNPDRILAGQVLTIPSGGSGTPGETPPTYTVGAGDTLFSLAREFGTTVTALVDANNLANANQISVGQVLTIPGASSPGTPGTGGPTTTYTVSTGDTLTNIALRFDVTVAQLIAANDITNPNLIFIGQQLTIPGQADTGDDDADDGDAGDDDPGDDDPGDDGDGDDETPQTIAEIVVGSDDFDTLEAAVIAAGLDTTLAGDGTFTVFAPTDAAFEALPEGVLDGLLDDPEGGLTDVLLYHVAGTELDAAAVIAASSIETLNGGSISVAVSDGTVTLDGIATVTMTDIEASNGVIHVIDAVLQPPSPETGGGDDGSEDGEEEMSEEEMMDDSEAEEETAE